MSMTDRPPALDIDAYIDALPSHRLREPQRVPQRYQTWSSYPLLKPYNGFDGVERRRGGQLLQWLEDAGCLVKPAHCEICRRRERLGFHSESYYHCVRSSALCRNCHRALHMRPWHWDAWRRMVDAAAVTGQEWFVLAPRYGIDIAEHLRNRWGWTAANIEMSPVAPLPEAIVAVLPCNLLHHERL
jgi:hypothetical protein